MTMMATGLGRLGSRYSLVLNPHGGKVAYGALGMLCQENMEMVVGLERDGHPFAALPFCAEGVRFNMVDQFLSATSVRYEAFDPVQAIRFRFEIISPFWPRDIRTCILPAYLVRFRIDPVKRIRAKVYSGRKEPEFWSYWKPEQVFRKGVLRFGFRMPGVDFHPETDLVRFDQPVRIAKTGRLQGDGNPYRTGRARVVPTSGESRNLLIGIQGDWRASGAFLEVPYDLDDETGVSFTAAFCTHCPDALFERFGQPMRLKYTALWSDVEEVAGYVRTHAAELMDKSEAFQRVFDQSDLPPPAQQLTHLSFQTFLMNTFWMQGEHPAAKDWFSVWEGNCLLHSTVDVEYNNALFYFACWPELLEMIFEEWAEHVNDAPTERRRMRAHPKTDLHADSWAGKDIDFPGGVLEHDMGSGWTANGQCYAHAMPVEENANFLLMLYAHGRWWGREELFRKYEGVNDALAEFLLYADTTGNGFADQGTANTIDDGAPALQYGRDGVYLGVKRLAALHAARRMLAATGREERARQCALAVEKAVATLQENWLQDHYPVCLDSSAIGLLDANTAKPVPFETVPGWNDYSIHTANGLLYLLMVDDVPEGLDLSRLCQDVKHARRARLTDYGSSHPGKDDYPSIWISQNIWRDCIAGYLGCDFLSDAGRYWALQEWSNSAYADKPNCFMETAPNNNLSLYPRGAASFGLPFAAARLTKNRAAASFTVEGIRSGVWPLLPMADWTRGTVPFAVVELADGRLVTTIKEVRLDGNHPDA